MPVTIDPTSVKLTVTPSRGHATFAHLGTARLLLFCGAGGINLKAADADAPADMRKILHHAISWKGQVNLAGDPKSATDVAEAAKWTFGFLQVSNTMVEQSVYAGRAPNEGSMVANKKLGYSPNPCIDSGDTPPFVGSPGDAITTKSSSPQTVVTVSLEDGDHPNYMLPLTRQNMTASSKNFLFSARRDEGFTTVFTAVDPTGKKTFLAHFDWHVIWHCELRWKTGDPPTPSKVPVTMRFDIGPVRTGAPRNSAILAVCNNPVPPSANDLDRDAEIAIWDQRKEPLLTQSKARSADIPDDFFT